MGQTMNDTSSRFVGAKVHLHDAVVVRDGVLSADEGLRLLRMQDVIDRLLEGARREAEAIVAQARQEAEQLLGQARQACDETDQDTRERAESLLTQISQEWRRVVESLEPTAVAVARLAIERVCAGATLADRVDVAARAAIRELPERPVRLRVPPGARGAVAASLSEAMEVLEDASLAPGSVCVEGEQGACDASFDVAQATVTSFLGGWAERASRLIQGNQPPLAVQARQP
jgi:flagellar biosynthesis/type III secretory pathway protein FliH